MGYVGFVAAIVLAQVAWLGAIAWLVWRAIA